MVLSGLPRPPAEVADAVELYARESGRHATLIFFPVGGRLGCWVVRFTLKPGDPRLRLVQEDRVAEEPTEDMWLHEPLAEGERPLLRTYPYRPLNLHEMGASGIRAWLERGNLQSGRGEYRSILDQLKRVVSAGADASVRRRAEGLDRTQALIRDRRRWYQRAPSILVRWIRSRKGSSSPSQE